MITEQVSQLCYKLNAWPNQKLTTVCQKVSAEEDTVEVVNGHPQTWYRPIFITHVVNHIQFLNTSLHLQRTIFL